MILALRKVWDKYMIELQGMRLSFIDVENTQWLYTTYVS
jgi:hypothetical protein